MMENIQKHIATDRDILEDPTISSQYRRHIEDELDQLESYQDRHPEDDHDPTALELYCDTHPDASECRVYED